MWVKICGITSIEDARAAIDAGADAVGLNLVRESARFIERNLAKQIAEFASPHVEVVGVVADQTLPVLSELRLALGLTSVQLHGNEPASLVDALGDTAYKAVRVANSDDVIQARTYGGRRLLVDSKVSGKLGGTGYAFDWSLVSELSRSRPIILAGGLNPANVAQAVQALRPWGVDVASGVEEPGLPRTKNPQLLRDFVERAKSA